MRTFDQGTWDDTKMQYKDDDQFGTRRDAVNEAQVDHWLRNARLKKVGDRYVQCTEDEVDRACTAPIERHELLADPYTRSGFKGVSSRTWLPRRRLPAVGEDPDEVDEEELRAAHGKDSTRARRWIGYYTKFREKDEDTKAMQMNRALLGMYHHKFFAALAHALAHKVYEASCAVDKEAPCDDLVRAGFAIKELVQTMDRCHRGRPGGGDVARPPARSARERATARAKGARGASASGTTDRCARFNLDEWRAPQSSMPCDGYVSVDPGNLRAELGGEDEEAAAADEEVAAAAADAGAPTGRPSTPAGDGGRPSTPAGDGAAGRATAGDGEGGAAGGASSVPAGTSPAEKDAPASPGSEVDELINVLNTLGGIANTSPPGTPSVGGYDATVADSEVADVLGRTGATATP